MLNERLSTPSFDEYRHLEPEHAARRHASEAIFLRILARPGS